MISPRSVQYLRRRLGLDPNAFAEKLGVCATTVALWESRGVSAAARGYIPVRELLNESTPEARVEPK